jgi:hypothetical protein
MLPDADWNALCHVSGRALLDGERNLGSLDPELCKEGNGYPSEECNAANVVRRDAAYGSGSKSTENKRHQGHEMECVGEWKQRGERPSASDDPDSWNGASKERPEATDAATELVGGAFGQRCTDERTGQERDERQEQPTLDDCIEPHSAVAVGIAARRERAEDGRKRGKRDRYFCQ